MFATLQRFIGKANAPRGEIAVVPEFAFANPPEWGDDRALKVFTENEWVFAGINAVASEVSSIRLSLRRPVGSGKNRTWEEVDDHPAIRLLRRPNTVHSGSELRETLQIHLELVGNAYLYIFRDSYGRPAELWPMDPTRVSLRALPTGPVEYYEYLIDGRPQTLDPRNVVHLRNANPRDLHYGAAPTRAAALSIDTDIQAARWNLRFFFNSARPDFILFLKKMSDEGKKRFRSLWRKDYAGAVKAHEPGIITADDPKEAWIHEFKRTQKDMDFVAQGEKLRDKIIAAYRVPKSLLGLTAEVNRASMEASIYQFARYTIKPKIQRFTEKLTIDLLNQFSGTDGWEYAFDDPVPENAEAALSEIQNGMQQGWMTPNEARARRGLPPIPGGEHLLVPFNKIPIESVVAPAAEPSAKQFPTVVEQRDLRRDTLKRQFLQRHSTYEKRFADKVKALFADQEKRALARLAESTKSLVRELDPLDLLDEQKERVTFILESTALFELLAEAGGNSALEQVGIETPFDFDNPEVRKAVAAMTIRFASEVNETTIAALRAQLQEGIAAGEGAAVLARRVKTVFAEATTKRAVMIARTETTKGLNSGSFLGYIQAGVDKIEWIATEDDRTRPAHDSADGQVIELPGKFLVDGEELQHPGDPAGSPENIVNCRCTIAAAI